MHATDIVAYTFRAENLCPDCTVKAVCADRRLATTPAAWEMGAEDLLEQLAAYHGIAREDERSYDSDEFPKVVFGSQVKDVETCDSCGWEI